MKTKTRKPKKIDEVVELVEPEVQEQSITSMAFLVGMSLSLQKIEMALLLAL